MDRAVLRSKAGRRCRGAQADRRAYGGYSYDGRWEKIAKDLDVDTEKLAESNIPHDVPDDWFKGPF